MRKILAIVLVVALTLTLAGALGGCEKEKKPLRVCIDITGTGIEPDDAGCKAASQSFIGLVKAAGGPQDIELEYIPGEGAERDIMLTRIRTEVMAGQGPDVFITKCYTRPNTQLRREENDALFLFPEKIMKNGLFYPLDDFIENAQFMEWDKLTQSVMQAGYSEEYGQVILPLSYDFPAAFFRKEDVTHTPDKSITWNDMINDESGIMKAAAAWPETVSYDLLGSSFGALADYPNNKLLFTEDELQQRVYEVLAVEREHTRWRGTDTLPPYFQRSMIVNFEWMNEGYARDAEVMGLTDYIPGVASTNTKGTDVDLTMVPIYNDDGGVTATIHAFAAINANTKRADDAFFVLDFLLSKDVQQSSALSQKLYWDDQGALPVYEDLMTKEDPMAIEYGLTWYMTENNFNEFSAVRDQITQANFCGSLDVILRRLINRCVSINAGYIAGNIDKEISEEYGQMKRQLSE